MLSFGWHWFTAWLWGFGGLSIFIAVASGLLWYFTPPLLTDSKSVILHVFVGAAVFCAASIYYSSTWYDKGYAVAMSAIAAQNKGAADAAHKATDAVNQCFDSGGDWDIARRMCQH